MSKVKFLVLAIALAWSAFTVAQQFAPAIEYARAWDRGVYTNTFTTLAGLEDAGTAWIVDCRERWQTIIK